MHKQHFISNNSNCFQKPHLTCYPFIRKLSNLSKFHFKNFLSKLLWNDPLIYMCCPQLCSHCGWLLLKCSAIGIGFNGAETNCRIAHILGILLMNSCNTDRFLATTIICSLSTLNYLKHDGPYCCSFHDLFLCLFFVSVSKCLLIVVYGFWMTAISQDHP